MLNKLKIDLYSTLYNERLSDDKIEVQIALQVGYRGSSVSDASSLGAATVRDKRTRLVTTHEGNSYV